ASSLLCFLCCPAPLGDLRSFPTRRSSDLVRRHGQNPFGLRRKRCIVMCSAGFATGLRGPPCARRRPSRPVRGSAIWRRRRWWNRSEEHTSELQSRENLVCRLMLEKKNKNK